MGIPSDAPQLLILVTFVLPGLVYQALRSRLRGPTPDEIDATTRVLRAIAWSTFLALVYLVIFGDSLLDSTDGKGWFARHVRWSALLAVVLVFVVPAASRSSSNDCTPSIYGHGWPGGCRGGCTG